MRLAGPDERQGAKRARPPAAFAARTSNTLATGVKMDEVEMTSERLGTFSDAVFGVAITLLVLDLRVPEASAPAPRILELLRMELPAHMAFLASFLIIGLNWISHHNMLGKIGRVDNGLLLLNLLLLLWVCFVPFTTALLAAYATKPEGCVAAMLYGIVWAIGGLCSVAFWHYAVRRGLVHSTAVLAGSRLSWLRYGIAPAGYLLGALLSLLNVELSIVAFTLLATLNLMPMSRLP
jgi:uncharacterized membrane protein